MCGVVCVLVVAGSPGLPLSRKMGVWGQAKSPALLRTEELASRRAALVEQEVKGEDGERTEHVL